MIRFRVVPQWQIETSDGDRWRPLPNAVLGSERAARELAQRLTRAAIANAESPPQHTDTLDLSADTGDLEVTP